MVLRTALAAAVTFAAGLAIAYSVTDGFQAFTLESTRRLHALTARSPVPDLALELADGGSARLSELPGQVLLVDFVYTNCPTYCVALGSVYVQLRQRLEREIAAGKVRLVSISFDPVRDGAAELRAWRARYGAGPTGWDVGRPATADLTRWLEGFGVVVIPDGMGGYTHNAAVHVVGPDRRLVAIHGLSDIDAIVATARQLAGTNTVHVADR